MVASSRKPLSNLEDILDVVKAERNSLTRDELAVLQKEQPGSFDNNLSLKVGSRVFRDFVPSDLGKIKKAYQLYSIIDRSGGAVAEAALVAYNNTRRLAQKHFKSGQHYKSISLFVRSVGGTDVETTFARIQRNDLPERPVISIVSDVPYATKLETLRHHGELLGFLYQSSKIVQKEFGKAIQVKFDFFSSARLTGGSKGGTLPRLQISNPGDLRGRSSIPGRKK